MQRQETEEQPAVVGQRVICRDGQRRVWRAIDLLRQTGRGATMGRPSARRREVEADGFRRAAGT